MRDWTSWPFTVPSWGHITTKWLSHFYVGDEVQFVQFVFALSFGIFLSFMGTLWCFGLVVAYGRWSQTRDGQT